MKDTIDEIREIFLKSWSNAELLISELEKDVLLGLLWNSKKAILQKNINT